MTFLDALHVLHEAGKIGLDDGPGETAWGFVRGFYERDFDHFFANGDPMVLGCLLVLLREATGDPGVHVARSVEGDEVCWYVYRTGEEPVSWHSPTGWCGATEAAALEAALVAVAREMLP